MTNSWNIRFLEEDDLVDWKSLWDEYIEDDEVEATSEELFLRLIDNRTMVSCLVAEQNERVVGFLVYVLHPHSHSFSDMCYVADLYIIKDARGKGIATSLIDFLTRIGKKEGWRGIYWKTHENNETAQDLYDKIAQRTNRIHYKMDL